MISDRRLAEIRARISRESKGRGAESEPGSNSALAEELFAEVESLRDSTLAKDFLALYQHAHAVINAHQPALDDPELRIEGLALQVTRLAPLFDDVRRSLFAQKRAQNPGSVVDVMHDDGSTRIRRAREAGVDVVSIALGPTLRARVDALVKTHRIGSTLAHAVQTLFVLGLLDAEGQDPREHIGEPVTHFSVDGVFVRFALPHEVGNDSRREILRNLFAWLHAWLGDDERLQPAAAAALEALPR